MSVKRDVTITCDGGCGKTISDHSNWENQALAREGWFEIRRQGCEVHACSPGCIMKAVSAMSPKRD